MCGVGFGIVVDDYDFLVYFDEIGDGVLGGGGFVDVVFVVDSYFFYWSVEFKFLMCE